MPQTPARSRIGFNSGNTAETPKDPPTRSPDDVRVRMYCHGLGDCFLVAIPREGVRPFYMLIDCGVILGTKNSRSLMTSVVKDLATTTKEIDVVVVTHEHWDHISGFIEAEEAFRNLTVHDVWVAWTENPSDPLAQKLKAERKRTVNALRSAAMRMSAAEPGSEQSLLQVLGFFGPAALGAAGGHSTEDAMDRALALSSRPPRYCRPTDDPFQLTDLPGVRFYVLGPPQSERRIKQALPTKRGRETYDTAVALSPETSFLVAATRGMDNASELQSRKLQELTLPFDGRWSMPVEEAKEMEFFQNHYFGTAEAPDQKWRSIDTAWLGTAGQLALQLDTYTNNTSLVLAIEFLESGRVMLFAADAQVGNWLSWGDQTWRVRGDTDREVTVDDLLNRTVLYKVGHHGSHNATMRAGGLEKMNSSELTALVPVNREMAETKRWNGMPFPALMTRLQERTSGRVLRIDDERTPAEMPPPPGVRDTMWAQFQRTVTRSDDKLYYEIRLGIRGS